MCIVSVSAVAVVLNVSGKRVRKICFCVFSCGQQHCRKQVALSALTCRFCLACYGKQDIYWIGFVSDFGLYRRQTSQQGTILVPGLVAPKLLSKFTF